MGANKRYAAYYDGLMGQKLLDQTIREVGKPETLTEVEKALDRYALTRPPKPIPAKAWVRYAGVAYLVDVEIVAWTERVAAIRWPGPEGSQEQRAWVWSSAVDVRAGPRGR